MAPLDANIFVPVLLFIVLTPGLLLSLPAGASRTVQTLTHAAVFAAAYWTLRSVFPQYY